VRVCYSYASFETNLGFTREQELISISLDLGPVW
jgi:hypothetical protein